MNTSHRGDPRPQSARSQAVINSDGTTNDIRWISEPTAIKRLRRYLARSGCTLHKARPGTKLHETLGEYSILDESGEIVADRINLAAWIKSYGLLAAHERIEPPIERDWMFYVGRYERVVIDGISANYARPITKEYTTEAAALKSVAHLTGAEREGLVICGFSVKARNRAADKGGEPDGSL
jgi:hypothetical protein